MSTQMRADHFVDAKGQMCPMPILTLKKAWKDVAVGQIVAIAATDQGAKRDIPSWAEAMGATPMSAGQEVAERSRAKTRQRRILTNNCCQPLLNGVLRAVT